MPSFEASCATVNKSKLIENTKPGQLVAALSKV
jgi:hypothetical protein